MSHDSVSTNTEVPVYWVDMLFNAPLVGVRQRWPNVLHAVPMKGIPSPKGGRLCSSLCGLTGLRLLSGPPGTVVPWPPAVKGLAPMVRCKECFDACTKKRPRSWFAPKEEAVTP